VRKYILEDFMAVCRAGGISWANGFTLYIYVFTIRVMGVSFYTIKFY
jgi:hypothetical protein